MDELHIPVHPDYSKAVMDDPVKWAILVRCASDFRYFLNFWKFQDISGEVKSLGSELWSGQETFVDLVQREKKIYALKARQLGYTTLECAFDGWCLRFRDPNGRVHLFSKRAALAADLKWRVAFGFQRLPEWMQLPIVKNNSMEFHISGGKEDHRVLEAYPSDEETGIGQTCSHAHVDEWWRMGNPRKVWQAIEPSVSPRGSVHLITTGLGHQGYPAEFWRKTLKKDNEGNTETGFYGLFTSAFGRPDRDDKWFRQKVLSLPELERKQEYPETWEDALSGHAGIVFHPEDIEMAKVNAFGKQSARPGHKYVSAWDIGRHGDAAVGLVLDITNIPYQVVHYERHKGVKYNMLEAIIENVHRAYTLSRGSCTTVIEDNNAGEAVRENLDLPEEECHGFKTTGKSKPKIISGLQLTFANKELKYDGDQWPSLDIELRQYTWEDEEITQDSVIALAIANDFGTAALRLTQPSGEIIDVINW